MDQDEKIIRLLQSNSEKGLSMMIDTYAGLVYTIVYSKLQTIGTKEDIEECVSDIFYEIYNKIHEIDLTKGSLKSYLAVISKRRAIDTYRKLANTVNNIVYIDKTEYDHIKDDKTCIEDEVTLKETKELLIREIKNLGEPDSEIMIRKYFFGQSTKCISDSLKIKANTVDKKVSRGLAKLKVLLGGLI